MSCVQSEVANRWTRISAKSREFGSGGESHVVVKSSRTKVEDGGLLGSWLEGSSYKATTACIVHSHSNVGERLISDVILFEHIFKVCDNNFHANYNDFIWSMFEIMHPATVERRLKTRLSDRTIQGHTLCGTTAFRL